LISGHSKVGNNRLESRMKASLEELEGNRPKREKSQMIRRLVVMGLAMSCLLLADNGPQEVYQVTNTEHIDFPSGGTLRIKNSIDYVRLEGWDQPGVEITTVKAMKPQYNSADRAKDARELERVHIAVQRQGNEVVIGTHFPRHRTFSPPLFRRGTRFDLYCDIKVPQSAQLLVHHDEGDVFIENFSGGMHATVRTGQITLSLPEEGRYAIDAGSNFGGVNSDFPGREKRKPWVFGHEWANPPGSPAPSAAPNLYLRVGSGDIVIFKMPQAPIITPPVAAAVRPTLTLTVSPTVIQVGQSATLSWSSTNATALNLTPAIGAVATEGTMSVTPTDSTNYTITATGPGGGATATVRITVSFFSRKTD